MLKLRYFATCAALLAAAAVVPAAGQARAADPASAKEKEHKLIEVLRSDAPPQEKAITCKRLAVYGGKDAVPALAPLLSDERLASWARIALEAISDPAADEALRQAAGKLQGRLLIGAINSIGVRRDAKAVDILAGRLKDADPEVASAAAVALGRVGGAPAVAALAQLLPGAPGAVRGAVAEGCILCAEQCLAAGRRDEAVRLYDLVRKADVPKPRAIEATRGAILARGPAGVPLLVEQLKSADKAMFALGLRAARELPGPAVAEALVAELGRASPERQGLLILALADRGDAASVPAVLQAAKSGPNNVRVAAIRTLGRLGGASCVPVLLEAAMATDAELAETALEVLADVPGKDVDDDVAGRLAKAEGKARQVLIQLAGRRRIEAANAALLNAADDSDPQVRAAALTALGSTIGLGDLPVLIARVTRPQERPDDARAAEAALGAACARMADREACAEKLAAAMPQAPVQARCKLLEILGVMGGTKALQAVGAAAKDATPEIQDCGSRLLGEWMTADAAPVLLDLARNAADDKYKIRALRGYIRIVRQLNLPLAERIAMCGEASKLCRRDEEKKLVLAVLRRYPSAEGLALAIPHLQSPALKAEAGSAAVAIAEKTLRANPGAVAEAMKKVIEAGGDAKVVDRAKSLLEQATR
jgi:HEAT repeat protein